MKLHPRPPLGQGPPSWRRSRISNLALLGWGLLPFEPQGAECSAREPGPPHRPDPRNFRLGPDSASDSESAEFHDSASRHGVPRLAQGGRGPGRRGELTPPFFTRHAGARVGQGQRSQLRWSANRFTPRGLQMPVIAYPIVWVRHTRRPFTTARSRQRLLSWLRRLLRHDELRRPPPAVTLSHPHAPP
jgi:hypothetical protein